MSSVIGPDESALTDILENPIGKRPRLMDQIVDRLTSLIVEGRLEPGTVIRQEAIAKQLGVSRTPLREALQRLELDGLVVVAPSGSARVADYDVTEAREMMDVREMIDGLAARLLAERGLPAAVDSRLGALVNEMRQASLADDKHRYLVLNADFHVAMVEATRHRPLQQFLTLVRVTSQAVYLRLGHQPIRHQRSAAEHAAILDAIRGGDPAGAERAARAHIRRASDFWLRAPENGPAAKEPEAR